MDFPGRRRFSGSGAALGMWIFLAFQSNHKNFRPGSAIWNVDILRNPIDLVSHTPDLDLRVTRSLQSARLD